MNDREVAGVRRAITWLHERAAEMNDTHAAIVLNSASFSLGVQLKEWRALRPTPSSDPAPTEGWRDNLIDADGCFAAAMAEGWNEALAEGNIERIRDLWERRISYAHPCILAALATHPSSDLAPIEAELKVWPRSASRSAGGGE